MKKAKIKIKVNVPNDFSPGDCSECPLSRVQEKEVFYQTYETRRYCSLSFSSGTCPIEVAEK